MPKTDVESEFCAHCGADIPIRPGSGTCNHCDPEYVFVGGRNDGARHRTHDPYRPFKLQCPCMQDIVVHMEIEVYCPCVLWDCDKQIVFFRHESLTDMQALRLLIKGYRREVPAPTKPVVMLRSGSSNGDESPG